MGVLKELVLNFYILFSFLFIFGKKKEENTTNIPQPMQPGQVQAPPQSVQLPTPQNVSKPGEEKPMFRIEQPTIPYLPEAKDPRTLNVRYPLIPPYTFAKIRWDPENTELVYEIEEPFLTDKEKQTLDILEDGIKELINLSFISVKDRDTVLVYLEKNIRVLLAELSIELNIESFLKIMYYIYRDFVGLNELEPLMNDYFIEDVECNGLNTPVYIVHRKYRNIRTNLIYKDIHNMASFVEKLAQKCGRYVSYAEPVLDGSLPDNSRVNAIYSTDVTTRGPSFCIVDGYIQLNNGEVKKIDRLFENCKKDFGCKVDDNNEVVKVTNLKCCGVNEKDLSQNDSRIKTIIKLSPPERLVELRLEDGTEITTTTNHMFHVADDKLELIEAEKLKHGMFIPIPNKIYVEGCNQKINAYNLLKEFSYNCKVCVVSNIGIKELVKQEILSHTKNEHNKYRQDISKEYCVGGTYFYEIISRGNSISFEVLEKICDNNNINFNEINDLQVVVYGGGRKNIPKSIKVPHEVNEDLAYLAGAIISDGHLGENHIEVSAYEPGFNNAVGDKLIKLFGRRQRYYNGNRVYLCNKFAPFFFNKIFGIPYGKKARIVNVPDIIFKSDNKIVAAFIRGLFDGDGTCKAGLSYKSYSKDLVYELSYLLARLGIYCYIRNDEEEYRLVIPSIYEKKYAEFVGFSNDFKIKCLNNLLRKKDFINKSYIRHGRVPAKPVLDLIKKLNISKNQISKICRVNYNRLYYDTLAKPFVMDIIEYIETKFKNEDLSYINWLVNCEQEFVRIDSARIFENNNSYPVYDIELEPCKFFIAGNKPMNIFDTVRKFTKEPWSPLQLMIKGTCSAEIYAYLWMTVEYENSLMVVGGTGSGKCVSGDTTIYLANGERKNIKDLVEEKFLKRDIIKENDWEYVVGDGSEILSIDLFNNKVEKTNVERFWRHKAPPLLLLIKTEQGRELKCTCEHLFFINTNNKIIKKRADQILIGDKIAYPNDTTENSWLSFDNVNEIKYLLDHGEEYVYDLTVNINHNFIAGKIPLVAHNTSFVNTVAFFIPPQARVVTIEDTKELQLEHENWLPSVARAGVGLTNLLGQKYGEVTLFDLLKASFRQRPDYIIVGEVRGSEAFVLFQAFASGHPGMATMHAESVDTMVKRLQTAPINLSGSLIETLAAVVVMTQSKIKGKEVRKVSSIDEIIQVKEQQGGAVINTVFKWDPKTDKFTFNPNSKVFENIAVHFGFTKEQVLNEFNIRVKLFKELFKRGIINFKEVQKIVHEYYKSPEVILKRYGLA